MAECLQEQHYQNLSSLPLQDLLRLIIAVQMSLPSLAAGFSISLPPLNDASSGGETRPLAALEEPRSGWVSFCCFSCINAWSGFGTESSRFPPLLSAADVKPCSHLEVFPCGGEGAGRYPLKNVNTRLSVQGFLRSAKPWQVQEFTGKPGSRRGVPSASRETASQAGRRGERGHGDGGRKPTPAEPPALRLLGRGSRWRARQQRPGEQHGDHHSAESILLLGEAGSSFLRDGAR